MKPHSSRKLANLDVFSEEVKIKIHSEIQGVKVQAAQEVSSRARMKTVINVWMAIDDSLLLDIKRQIHNETMSGKR